MTHPRMPLSHSIRRGLSILEILVAIGLILAVAAVAVPWTLGWLGSRELDDAGDRIAMQMLMARAAAREEGRPVEVVASGERGASSVEVRWVALDDAASGDAVSRGDMTTTDGYLQSSIDADWASFALPSGLSIAVAAARSSDDIGEESATEDATDDVDTSADAAAPQTLALFLPDGTVLMAPIFMLRTDAGIARAMRVDRATGRARVVEHPVAQESDAVFDRPEFDAPSDDARGSTR
ncbi:MAG: Tfp pilus assembly protein FimT/FimU [bacterium]